MLWEVAESNRRSSYVTCWLPIASLYLPSCALFIGTAHKASV